MSVSYLKVICAQSWGHIEAFGDLRSAKNKLTAALFLIHNQMNHPVLTMFLYFMVNKDLPRMKPLTLNIGYEANGYNNYVQSNLKLTFLVDAGNLPPSHLRICPHSVLSSPSKLCSCYNSSKWIDFCR